jgi:hypothetical protein
MRKKGTGMVYRIVVQDELSDRYAAAFEGMQLETRDGRSLLGRSQISPTSTASSTA